MNVQFNLNMHSFHKEEILDYVNFCSQGSSQTPLLILKIYFLNNYKSILSIIKPGFLHLNVPFIDIGLNYTDVYAYEKDNLYLVEGNCLLETNYKFDLGYIEKHDFIVYTAICPILEPILVINKMIYNDSLLYKFYSERK